MAKSFYIPWNPRQAQRELVAHCNVIIDEYTKQGLVLTLRQLYYQLFAQHHITNDPRSYDNFGEHVKRARYAGLIDWDAIEDRTRELVTRPHWSTPDELLAEVAEYFHVDMWATQKFRPEVWIEKEALVGVIGAVCQQFDVPYFAARGNNSSTAMRDAANRFLHAIDEGKTPVLFYLGDHDSNGIDMSRDIPERLWVLMRGRPLRFERLALNIEQAHQYNLPPSPVKVKDSRAPAYVKEFGNRAWELDALEPRVLNALIRGAITKLIDKKKWAARLKLENAGRKRLQAL